MPRRTAITEQRIEHIAAMMRRLEWRTGDSGPALAREWRLSRSSLEKLAAEASRRVRAEVTDPGAVTLTVCAALEKTLRDALADGDRKSVIRAAATWSRIVRPASMLEERGGAPPATCGAIVFLPARPNGSDDV